MKRIILVIMIFLAQSSLFAMFLPQRTIFPTDGAIVLGQDQDIGLMKSKDQQVFELVFQHAPDHKAMCNFGQTSKDNDQFMLSLYPRNRQNIRKSPKFKERFAKKENTKETAIIKKEHRYGSANCYACKLKKKDSKELWFTRCEFSDAEIEIKNVNFSDFHRSVRAQSTPFFDKQGKMCIYGYGQKRTDTDELYPHAILKYCSDGSHRFCTVNIKGVSTWCLHNFGWHSPIFDAILAVPEEIQDIELAEDEIEQCFVRSFDKVIIPDNYKAEDQFYPTKNISYGEMFRRLDPKTQAVVDERYQEQQQNKIKDCAVSTL